MGDQNTAIIKKYGLVAVLLLAYLIFTLATLSKLPFFDESEWTLDAKHLSFNNQLVPHPPLSAAIYKLTYFFTDNMRWAPILFNFASLLVLFLWINKRYSKRMATSLIFLLATSFWFILSSTQIDQDGAFINLFFILGFIILLEIKNSEMRKKIIFISVIFILLIYSKYVEFIIFSIIYLFWLIQQKNISLKKKISFLIFPPVLSIAIFMIFPIITYLSGNFNYFLLTIGHTGGVWSLVLRPILVLLTYGPLLLIFLSLSANKKTFMDPILNLMFGAAIIRFMFFFFMIGGKALPYERYLMGMIVPLMILGAYILEKNGYFKEKYNFLIIAISYVLFVLINLRNVAYIPHNASTYLSNAMHLNFSFNLPYTGSSGPAFYINFESVALLLIASAILFSTYVILKNKKMMYFLISINIAFSLFLVSEYSFSITHPNYGEVMKRVYEYSRDDHIKEPIYFDNWHKAIMQKLGVNQSTFFIREDESSISELKEKGGSVIFIDFPKNNEKDPVILFIKNDCIIKKEVYEKNERLGIIYSC